MADVLWLSDEQWAVIEPFMPKNQPGPERGDDRRIISGILHVLTFGCRWRDCPAALAKAGWSGEAAAIDATYVKAHRSAQGGKGGLARKPSAHRGAVKRPRSTPSSTCPAAPAASSPPATPAT